MDLNDSEDSDPEPALLVQASAKQLRMTFLDASDASFYGLEDSLFELPVPAVVRDDTLERYKPTVLWEYLENMHARIPFPRAFFQ